jgi:hypothetical protein
LSSALDDGGKPDGVEMKPGMVGKMKIKNLLRFLPFWRSHWYARGRIRSDSHPGNLLEIWGWTFGNM